MLKLSEISPLPNSVIEFLTKTASIEQVDRMIVFGSRAFLDHENYSDLDLAIDAPLITKKEWIILKEIAYYEVRTVLQLSLVHWNSNPVRLQEHIVKTGKIIYVK
ncbi:nucleotidyltransferase domain-containing protein [Muricauda sp. 334s03]|uniref:Nucleotidyltransferase domain-containing protein n=1 Tax=Flagellimonas yonaguniensis TaxID=3031325 RepID=A0ABT5XX47_9FLAO|nr:nucleotidyltransferase domain-containing protein [[Muricauda] yonaguniensis]MDF0715755.1 nucleotidyltransferase domain-containing protein [[Muricauda] yonaguniensis]